MKSYIESFPESEIINPSTSERMTVLRSSASTGNQLVRIQFTLPPGAKGPPLHYHRGFTEEFFVLEGGLLMIADASRQPRVVGAGESVRVAPGLPHNFSNPGPEPVTFIVEATPAKGFESFIRAHYGLAAEGLAGPSGMPRNALQVVVLLHLADFYFPGVPAFLQLALRRVLVGIARMTGADTAITKYQIR